MKETKTSASNLHFACSNRPFEDADCADQDNYYGEDLPEELCSGYGSASAMTWIKYKLIAPYSVNGQTGRRRLCAAGLDLQYKPTKNHLPTNQKGYDNSETPRWKALGEEDPNLL